MAAQDGVAMAVPTHTGAATSLAKVSHLRAVLSLELYLADGWISTIQTRCDMT